MNQAPAADATRAMSTLQLSSPRHHKISVFPSAKLLMLPPIVQNGIKAEMVLVSDQSQEQPGNPHAPRQLHLAMVLTIPTKWSPPMHDEDAEPCTKINPYDRNLVLPPLPHDKIKSPQIPEHVNMLNMFETGSQVDGKFVMPRRQGDSGNFTFWSGGHITSFVKQAIMLGAKRGCRIKLKQAIADDAKLFLSGADCSIRMVFVFEPAARQG